MKYANIREEELKNKVAQDYFWIYDCSKIIGNVDFCVAMHQSEPALFEQESLLWAEAKKGSADIYTSVVQLILTIGKARSFDRHLPPPFLAAFDAEKIAFIPYADIHEVFYQNDFNWNVTPSNHGTKEFQSLLSKVTATIQQKALLYHFGRDDKDLERFIKDNLQVGKFGVTKVKIDKNNFMVVYNKWLQSVKPTIAVNWDIAKKSGIIDGDFYLADLLSQDNKSLKDKLFVLLKNDFYELDRQIDAAGFLSSKTIQFTDSQVAHTQFWNKYERPPKREYWDYIVERRDLLVPQDVRERKGSFFTPQIWVELSQKYLTDVLGEDWQDEYTVWDCAAGTGNLLNGLTNKYNVWASTLDRQDVEVMRDRIKNGANLLEDHVFQFDFLNDDFTKLPKPLQDIINDPKKRKKLVIYINPPYAETSGSLKTSAKKGVNQNAVHKKHNEFLKRANHELYAQFLARIYIEIPNCTIGEFSTLKALQGSHFKDYRNNFLAKLEKIFLCQADTFDNVAGKFPIAFKVWNTKVKEKFKNVCADVYLDKASFAGTKNIYSYDEALGLINHWIKKHSHKSDNLKIGELSVARNDMQNKGLCWISHKADRPLNITANTLIVDSIFLTVQSSIKATWLNDRDQFLYPNDKYESDEDFKNDCFTYSLFDGQNKISIKDDANHWIPFTEKEVNAREKFASNFMTQFINGKLKVEGGSDLLGQQAQRTTPLTFSPAATAVFDAGRALWQYYHQQPSCNVNAALYDIREHFQGRNAAGKMNNKSLDVTYTQLIGELRAKLKLLAQQIEPKVYEHGFLL
jgi:hypothetical protein